MPNEINDHDLLIRIDEKVSTILDMESRLRTVEIDNTSFSERINTNSCEIEKLRTTTNIHGWINSLAVVIGTYIAIIVKTP
jgi:hypothetical protein